MRRPFSLRGAALARYTGCTLLRAVSMIRAVLAAFALAVSFPAHAQDKPKTPKKPPVIKLAGYTTVPLEGFTLFVSDESKAHENDENYKIKPMEVLELELKGVGRVMPPKMLKILQTVKIFVEWDDPESKPKNGGPGVVVARYWYDSGRGAGMAMSGRDPRKANNIEILCMRHLTEKWQPGKTSEQIILLHELCHAVHSHLLGNKNATVIATFNQAMERGLYTSVKHESGRTLKPYASTNDHEYFAELSCAYLDRCAYFPFTREELKEHDPAGYQLMVQVWGTGDPRSMKSKEAPAETAAAKKPAAPAGPAKPAADPAPRPAIDADAAAKRLELIQVLIKANRTDKAKEKLKELIDGFPGTDAAKKAQELLDGLK